MFHNQSNKQQLPVSIQLAIFLFRAGHYGNACSPEDVAQWAGVSVGTVCNCTHRVMGALLECHDKFIAISAVDSQHMCRACAFTTQRTCCAWQNNVFVVDSTSINLYAQPGMFSDGFYD